MNKTKIEYLTHTWNPIAMRCTRVSVGCRECWHLAMADRLAENPALPDVARAAYAGERPPLLIEDRLEQPLKHKKPALIGVQFMGDLFHEDVPERVIYDMWAVMAEAYWHAFQVLTKRPERMLKWVSEWLKSRKRTEPLGNVWLGITAENQQMADERIPFLLQAPAAVRFVSCEPLLGPIDLTHMRIEGTVWCDSLMVNSEFLGARRKHLDLVIVGGESGPDARPMHPAWARSLRDQCLVAGVPFFFKQWGAWKEIQLSKQDREDILLGSSGIGFRSSSDSSLTNGMVEQLLDLLEVDEFEQIVAMRRVSKKAAGHLLDGQSWQMPPDLLRSEVARASQKEKPLRHTGA